MKLKIKVLVSNWECLKIIQKQKSQWDKIRCFECANEIKIGSYCLFNSWYKRYVCPNCIDKYIEEKIKTKKNIYLDEMRNLRRFGHMVKRRIPKMKELNALRSI